MANHNRQIADNPNCNSNVAWRNDWAPLERHGR